MVGEILGRMKNLGEKSREKIFLVTVWLKDEEEKNLIGLGWFLPESTKNISLQNEEKTEWKMLMKIS